MVVHKVLVTLVDVGMGSLTFSLSRAHIMCKLKNLLQNISKTYQSRGLQAQLIYKPYNSRIRVTYVTITS